MDENASVAVALADLKGEIREQFARVHGRLDGALQKDGELERRVELLEGRQESIRSRIWQLCTIVAVLSSGSAAGLTQLISG